MLRRALLSASRSERIKHAVSSAPISRDVVRRFVAGETSEDALAATAELVRSGRLVTLDHLGEDTLDRGQAEVTRDAYLRILAELGSAGLSEAAEVSVKLSAVGQALGGTERRSRWSTLGGSARQPRASAPR